MNKPATATATTRETSWFEPADNETEDVYVVQRRRLFSPWALFAIAAVALAFLVQQRDGLSYWLSRAPRIDIGHFADTHPERAPSGSWVHVAGIASPVRGTYTRFFTPYELLHLLGSNVIVLRPEGKDVAEYRGYGFRYDGEGRLFRLADVPELAQVRDAFAEKGEIARDAEVYLLKEGEVPHRGAWPWIVTIFYSMLFVVNLLAGLRRRRRP